MKSVHALVLFLAAAFSVSACNNPFDTPASGSILKGVTVSMAELELPSPLAEFGDLFSDEDIYSLVEETIGVDAAQILENYGVDWLDISQLEAILEASGYDTTEFEDRLEAEVKDRIEESYLNALEESLPGNVTIEVDFTGFSDIQIDLSDFSNSLVTALSELDVTITVRAEFESVEELTRGQIPDIALVGGVFLYGAGIRTLLSDEEIDSDSTFIELSESDIDSYATCDLEVSQQTLNWISALDILIEDDAATSSLLASYQKPESDVCGATVDMEGINLWDVATSDGPLALVATLSGNLPLESTRITGFIQVVGEIILDREHIEETVNQTQ